MLIRTHLVMLVLMVMVMVTVRTQMMEMIILRAVSVVITLIMLLHHDDDEVDHPKHILILALLHTPILTRMTTHPHVRAIDASYLC